MTMKKFLIMQENELSGTIPMYPSTMQPLCTHVDKLVTSYFQICFLVYMLNIATCRTCPEAEITLVSPTCSLGRSLRSSSSDGLLFVCFVPKRSSQQRWS